MPDLLATDGLSYVLGLTAAVAFLLHTYLTPQSLVHPILLGRQSDVERVRQKGESAVYRNYATGLMGRLPIRPENNILKIGDLVKTDFTGSRTLWSTKITNDELKNRASSLASGLVRIAGLQPKESNVLLLTDGLPFLLVDLALASHGIPSFTISSLTLLSTVLENHPPSAIVVDVGFAQEVLELIMDNREFQNHTLILVGEGDVPKALEKVQVKVLWLSDLERQGAREGPLESAAIGVLAQEPEDVFSIAFYPGPNNELKGTQITHQNITAGVAATRGMFPLNEGITTSDSVVSSFALSTPYGRTIAYAMLYEGAHFTTYSPTAEDATMSPDSEIRKIAEIQPQPTIVFASFMQLSGMIWPIIGKAKDSWLFPVAWRQKVFHLQNGFLSKDSLFDRWVFAGSRKSVLRGMSDSLRGVVMSGGVLNASMLNHLRVALSIPFVYAHSHPLVAGPVFASHPLDLQTFPISATEKQGDFAAVASVGPPSINVEVKMVNVNDEGIEGGADPTGEIAIRGPSVTLPLKETSKPHSWVLTGDRGLAQPNGTFKVIPTSQNELK